MHVRALQSQCGSTAILGGSAPVRHCRTSVIPQRSCHSAAVNQSDAVLSKPGPSALFAVSWSSPAAFAAVATATLLLGFTDCPIAEAYNVRLQDVDSPQLKEGLKAATSRDFVRAESIFKDLLLTDSTSASTWSNLGNVHLSLGRPALAVDDYTHAISLAPTAPVPYLNRALALEQLGVDEEEKQAGTGLPLYTAAMKDCNDAIERDPQEFAAWFNKGNVAMRLDDYPLSLDSFQRAADLAPGIAGYRLRAAQLLFQNGMLDDAVQTAGGVARKNGNYAEAHVTLAALLWNSGEELRAEGEMERALQLEPRWRDMEFVKKQTRWPPALYEALQRFLTLDSAVLDSAVPIQE